MTYLLIIVFSPICFLFLVLFVSSPANLLHRLFSLSRFSCSKLLHDFSFFLSVVGRTGVNIVKKSSYAARPETDRRHG
jgi:hypothetical protein